jgi:hypothetical protein
VRLSIDPSCMAVVTSAADDALLGIILQDGSVLIRKADRTSYPGHVAWVGRDSIENALRGFSLAARHGCILGLATASVLNPGPECKLESELTTQLELLFPLDPEYRRLEE